MFHAKSLKQLRQTLNAREGTLAFVPTMGNLHQGHLFLVEAAKKRADRVVTSIFVNPMQFGEGEDFEHYPRTLEQDMMALSEIGNDVLFTPSVEELYPRPLEQITRVSVPLLSEPLCGHSRPGHFDGVCTIVAKLFNMVQPDIALFGEKDYQQLQVIRRMVADLNMPIQIQACATQREADGLAMSSRNRYLDAEQRQLAPLLYQRMQQLREQVLVSSGDFAVLCENMLKQLRADGFRPDYLEIRDGETLQITGDANPNLRIFAAVYLGSTRLIDNLKI